MMKICEICGKEFKTYKKKAKYCSRTCTHNSCKKFNKIIIKNNYAEIILESKTYGENRALIDLEDIDKIKNYRWHAHKNLKTGNCYVQCSINVKDTIHLHRVVMNCPENMCIDHIDGNGLNCLKSNLRICTQGENNQNKKSAYSNNKSSGVRGVSWDKRYKKWVVHVQINGKQHWGGYFKDIEEAKNKAINMRKELMTHNIEH